MPHLQAVVRVLRPCKSCRVDFLACLGVCCRKMTIFGVAEAEKFVSFDVRKNICRQTAIEVNLRDNYSLRHFLA